MVIVNRWLYFIWWFKTCCYYFQVCSEQSSILHVLRYSETKLSEGTMRSVSLFQNCIVPYIVCPTVPKFGTLTRCLSVAICLSHCSFAVYLEHASQTRKETYAKPTKRCQNRCRTCTKGQLYHKKSCRESEGSIPNIGKICQFCKE